MTVSVLHLMSVVALDLSALAFAACCLHLKEAYGVATGLGARSVLAVAVLAVVVNGVLDHDLALAAVVDLALLLGLVTPLVMAPSRR
jgi:hypothetical protein